MKSFECRCDARFSGVDEAEYAARGCPSCTCEWRSDFEKLGDAFAQLKRAIAKEIEPVLKWLAKVIK